MNIVKRELKAQRNSLIIWCFAMVFLIYAGMIKYTGFAEAGAEAVELLNQFPPAFKAAFGWGELDITSIAGYYAVFYLYFMVLSGLHAIMLGATIISKEERDKTADFLFAKPLWRSKIITAKLIAVFINIMVLNLVTLTASLVFVGLYNKGNPIIGIILRLMISLFIIQLIFAALGTALAAAAKNFKKATSLAAAVLLTTFLISVAIDLYHKIDFLKYITPFKYFPAVEILKTGTYAPLSIFLSLLLIGLALIITYRLMEKRDLHM
ncbi:MAG: ABC transporter permease subunit [Syntrophomonadaceae bacterium]|jgi:ABC-2 type transport system permease protein